MLLPISASVTVPCLLHGEGKEREIGGRMTGKERRAVGREARRDKTGDETRVSGGTEGRRRRRERKVAKKWLKHSFRVPRQLLLTFNSVCATWCGG